MKLNVSAILGCYEIQPEATLDLRGRFVKVFNKNNFLKHSLVIDFAEDYYSNSHAGVIRGMHFQKPPMDHVKIVYCVEGEVFDVVIDLRKGSPSFGKTAIFILSADKANSIYIPKGLAHGFCVTSEKATVVYKVSTVHSPEHDSGILWNSIGVDWPCDSPTVSNRDSAFVPFSSFESPFIYE